MLNRFVGYPAGSQYGQGTSVDESDIETTLYSLKGEAPSECDGDDDGDRRSGERHMTLFRVGSIRVDDRRELCLIKNISAGGMMIRAYCTLEPDTPISVELKCGEPVSGKVSWVRDNNVGVAFDQPIDVLAILSGADEGPRPRMPRIEIDCPITLHVDGRRIEARGIDVSQGGIKVEAAEPLVSSSDIVVTLPGMAPEAGLVRWQADDQAGITFNRLLPLASLVNWLQQLRDGLRRTG